MKFIALIEVKDEEAIRNHWEDEGYETEDETFESMVESYIGSTLSSNAQYDNIDLKVKLVRKDCKLSDIL